MFDQKGLVKDLPLLLIIATIGFISFILIGSIAPFNKNPFKILFPKQASNAAPSFCPLRSLGDIDCDGRIDIQDYNIILTNLGKSQLTTTPLPIITSTPNPSPTITPPPPPASTLWIPPVQLSWQWMIDHPLDVTNPKDMGLVDPNGNTLSYPAPQMYDIDGFINGIDPNCNIKQANGACTPNVNNSVSQLHAMGKKVVCYIDTGVYESYRPDAYKFPQSVIGSVDKGWNGSFWLDIRQTSILFPIMDVRIKMCKDKGYDSIEPDEMVDYSNNSGFPLTYQDQLAYNKGIASIAHKYGISIALKDDPEQARDLVGNFDWMLDEQCYQYNECDLLNSFSQFGKSVMDVEYNISATNFCPNSNSRNLNSMQMPLNLNGGRWPCR